MDAEIIALSLIQFAREALSSYMRLAEAQAKARAEGRDLSDAELDEFRAEAMLERARLVK